jgi:deazaflavin-dependent oxidoreductase (nitroreductase family)
MSKHYRLGYIRRIVNRLISWAISRGKMDDNMVLLTTVGRKSGQERTTPVTLVVRDGHRYIVSPYGTVGWVYNVRESGSARLERGGKIDEITVTEADADSAAPVLKQYVKAISVVRPYFDADKDDPVEAFAVEASQHPVFRIDE